MQFKELISYMYHTHACICSLYNMYVLVQVIGIGHYTTYMYTSHTNHIQGK